MMGITMPALAKTRQIAFRMVCAQNLSALGNAMHIYANDYNDMFPTTSKWCDLLVEYQNVSKQTFACPAALTKYRSVRSIDQCNYAMNKNVEKLGTNAPPDMVLLFETQPGWNQAGGPEILTTANHQGEGCNILFVDGHIEFVRTAGLKNLRWSEKEDKIAPLESPPLLPPPSPPPLRVVPLTGVKGNEKGVPEPNQ
jgi:prepilin-type processing-associated H-X9-DG protein